jgi:YHS domain-containing protein
MRYLLFIVSIYILYRLLKVAWKVFTRPNSDSKRISPNGKVIDEMVQDPFCKTYIPRRDAVKKIIKGQELYFCSQECADKFEKSNG